MGKRVFYTEAAYLLGVVGLAIGTALQASADLGVSMVVAPAYLLHLKLSPVNDFFTFGAAEYTLQAVLLGLMMIILRRCRPAYLFSFVTAVLYGVTLDGAMLLVGTVPADGLAVRMAFYVLGLLCCSSSVALLFRTYIPPEAYELFVKEVSAKYGIDIHKFKTVYDCASCLIAIAMSFAFFGMWKFEGIKIGTVLCALVNGRLISAFTAIFEKRWRFEDGLSLKRYFQ